MCIAPVFRKNGYYKEDGRDVTDTAIVPAPCGKCFQCVKDRASQWYVRLKYELKFSTSAYFVTLTYADPPISPNGHYTGRKSDLQKFLKRMRHYDSTYKRNPKTGRRIKCANKDLSYYAVLEYGHTYQRPHYHLLIFNLRSIRSVFKAWAIDNKPIGNCHEGKVENASIRYVCGYIGKKIGIGEDPQDDRLPEFSLMSKGLGIDFITTAGKFNLQNQEGYTVIDGVTYTLPRYYKNKLFPYYKARYRDTNGNNITKTRQNPISKQIGKKNLVKLMQKQIQEQKLYGSVEAYERNKFDQAILKQSNPITRKTKFS